MIPAATCVAAAVLLVASPLQAADTPDAQAESVRGVGTFESDPIGIELDRLLELPFDLAEDGDHDPDETRPPVLSTFTVFPKFEIDLITTDNIFRSERGEVFDLITIYRPLLDIRSDWENHFLSFNAQLDVGRHRKNPIEDYEDYTLGSSFVLDIDDFTSANAGISHSRSHGLRGDIDDPGQALSTDIQYQNNFSVGIARAIPDGLEADASFSVAKVSFENNGPINNDDRWRTDYTINGRLGWEIEQGTSVFIAPAATLTRFKLKLDDFGTNRDFDDYQLAAGIRLNPSPITYLEFLAGLTHRRFEDEVFSNVTDRLVRGTFLWNPTTVLTVNGSIDQSFAPAATAGVSGTLTRTYSTSVDWTPWDPLILSASAALRTEDFEGSVPDRSRQAYILGLSADWAINRNFYTSISATTDRQTGDLDVDDVIENRLHVRVGGQL